VCNPASEQWVTMPISGWIFPQLEEDDSDDNDDEISHTYLLFDPAVSSHVYLVLFAFKRSC
jgi:hypothetical protein